MRSFFDPIRRLLARVPVVAKSVGEFFLLLYRDFDEMRCTTRASALSYASVLAIVPLLAVTISISKNFLRDASQDLVPKIIDRVLFSAIPLLDYVPSGSLADSVGTPPTVPDALPMRSNAARERIIKDITTFVENINYSALGAVGMLFLLFVGVRLIESVENAVNDIWGVARGRGRIQRLVYYWTALTLGPLVILLGLGSSASWGIERLGALPILNVIPHATSNLVVLWLVFGLLYLVLPNTRVRVYAALAGGIVGGSLWRANSLLSALYFRRAVGYATIYGSLGLLLVILVGIYFSWLIFLLGAVVSYRAQHMREHQQEKALRRVNQSAMEFLAVHLMLYAVRRFLGSMPPATTEMMARDLMIPERVAGEAVRRLTSVGLLAPISMPQAATGYQPATDPHAVCVLDILERIRSVDAEWLDPGPSAEREWLRGVFQRIRSGALEAGGKQTLADGVRESSGITLPAARPSSS
ncbi:YihY/virulence factor BrkB family protein [Candidatus Fermentibacteria bacterium]|nr:YihY/virulence factor BrkB family protein [Candidatus Fermentibacteria bacterium]